MKTTAGPPSTLVTTSPIASRLAVSPAMPRYREPDPREDAVAEAAEHGEHTTSDPGEARGGRPPARSAIATTATRNGSWLNAKDSSEIVPAVPGAGDRGQPVSRVGGEVGLEQDRDEGEHGRGDHADCGEDADGCGGHRNLRGRVSSTLGGGPGSSVIGRRSLPMSSRSRRESSQG